MNGCLAINRTGYRLLTFTVCGNHESFLFYLKLNFEFMDTGGKILSFENWMIQLLFGHFITFLALRQSSGIHN